MPNLNKHDLIFLNSKDFEGFSKILEEEFDFKIISTTFPDSISFTSRKAIVNTNIGNFFLKEKPHYCSDRLSLARSADFQNYAAAQLRVIPRIVTTKKQDCYITWNERYYFLTEYKKGRHYNGSLKDIDFMLSALLSFQECGATYFKKYKDTRSDELSQFESFDIALGIYDLKNQIRSHNERVIFNKLVSLYENLRSEYINLPKEKYIMSHGDFILFNLVLNGSELIAINDFDNVKVLPRIHDMAEFLVSASLINYIAPLTNLKFPVLVSPDRITFAHIMHEYVKKFGLSNIEMNLLGSVVEIVWLWTLALAVFKGDYLLSDLSPAIEILHARKLKSLVDHFCV